MGISGFSRLEFGIPRLGSHGELERPAWRLRPVNKSVIALESGTPRLGSRVRVGIRRLRGIHCCLESGTPRLAEWCE